MKNHSYDIVIIGAGLSGLSLGALLSHKTRKKILVVEKNPFVGGRAHVSEKGGYLLDHGIHATLFSQKTAAARIFGELGRSLSVRNVGMCFYEQGETINLFDLAPRSFLGKQKIRIGDLLNLILILISSKDWHLERLYGTSVKAWCEEKKVPRQIQDILKGMSIGLLATTAYDRASLGEIGQFLRTVLRLKRALGYPVGGWRAVLDPLQKAIEKAPNAELRLGTRVSRILIGNGEVKGVMMGDERITASQVVCAFPPQHLVRKRLVPMAALPKEYIERLRKIRETAGISVDIGLRQRISGEKRIFITLDPPSLGWLISNAAPEIVPQGKGFLTLFSPMPVEDLKDRKALQQGYQLLYDHYSTIFPGLRENTEWRRHMPLIVNGAELNVDQHLLRRPSIKVPGVKGLFLIGDAVACPGAGGEIAFNSALRCYEMLMEQPQNIL